MANELVFDVGIIRVARVALLVARLAKLPKVARSYRANRFFSAAYKIIMTLGKAAPMVFNVAIVFALWLYMYVGGRPSQLHFSFILITDGSVCLCLCLWSGPIVEYVLSDWLLPVVPCLRC